MSLYHICFSPTGGTERVGACLAAEFETVCRKVDIFQKDGFQKQFEKQDLCIISAPSYAGRVPAVARERLLSLKADGTPAVVVAVFGNRAIDDTLIELSDLAAECGFSVFAGVEAVAEHSLARVYGKGRPDAVDRRELADFARQIRKKWESGNIGDHPVLPGNRPYKPAKRFPMELDLGENCTDCKKCAVECPTNAISIRNVSKVDPDLCISCMHCVTACPTGARKTTAGFDENFKQRLQSRCSDRKENKLYI